MKKITEFNNLIVWQKAHELTLLTYKYCKDYPREEMYGLTSQMKRASISVQSNIAEGFGRRTRKEKIRFYSIAEGSLVELQNQIIISKDLKFISDEYYKKYFHLTIEVSKLIRGSIRSLITTSY